jgi:uncharacterized membrane protein
VGEDDVLLTHRLDPLISSMATISNCLILPILLVVALARGSADFILNILDNFMKNYNNICLFARDK